MARRQKRQFRRRGGRRGQQRYRTNLVAIPFNVDLTLAGVADNFTTVVAMTGALEEDFYCFSMEVALNMRDHTALDGPIRIGFAHGDYSVQEINEALDVTILTPDDKIEQERLRRLVRQLGKFMGQDANEVINDGLPFRKKVGWVTGDGEVLNLWARNISGGTFTTGTNIGAEGLLFGRWLR